MTNKVVPEGSKVKLFLHLPTAAYPVRISGEVVRSEIFSHKKNICVPSGIRVKFINLAPEFSNRIQELISNPKISPLPELKIHFEPRFCYLFAVDLSIGCQNGCIYCHFSEANKKAYKLDTKRSPTPVDITSLYTMNNIPSPIFLSPSSDPFSKQNKFAAHELLAYLLPKGINFIILTKCNIPDNTLKIIEKYKNQFEGIAIGVSNLDENRNKAIEPGCPPAKERLVVLKKLIETGVKNVRMRMDPIFPLIDDNDQNLESMVKTASELGIRAITATYIFSFGKFLRRLNRESLLKESVKYINEKSPMQGGVALSVSLSRKVCTYEKLFALCNSHNIHFNICGCKENRLKEMGFSLTCRNPDFYHKENK